MNNEINDKDINLLKTLFRLNEKKLLRQLRNRIGAMYPKRNTACTDDYLYFQGKSPITLVAHADTVFEDFSLTKRIPNQASKPIYYDRENQVMWSPEGLGADDRAGIFIILKILEAGLRPNILITTGEEKGGIGSYSFISDYKDFDIKPFGMLKKGTKYLLQLDRMGIDDSVFYSCGNSAFEDYVNSFGFQTQMGSFSDISILCPSLGVAGVNVSVGYCDEHSFLEHLFLKQTFKTIDKVIAMIKDSRSSAVYEYIERSMPDKKSVGSVGVCEICLDETQLIDYGSLGKICSKCMGGLF